jgi:hypothetical protein
VARGPRGSFINVPKDATGICQKQFAGCTQFHAARQPIEKFERQFGFQILNLGGQSRLSDIQPLRSAPVVFLFANGYEISEMPQFHTDILKRSV